MTDISNQYRPMGITVINPHTEYRYFEVGGYPLMLVMRDGIAVGQLEFDVLPPFGEYTRVVLDPSGEGNFTIMFMSWMHLDEGALDEDELCAAELHFMDLLGYPEDAPTYAGHLDWAFASPSEAIIYVIENPDDPECIGSLIMKYEVQNTDVHMFYQPAKKWIPSFTMAVNSTNTLRGWCTNTASQIQDLAVMHFPGSGETIH